MPTEESKVSTYVGCVRILILIREMVSLTDEQEAEYCGQLDLIWYSMSDSEQQEAEELLQRAPEVAYFPELVDTVTVVGTSIPPRQPSGPHAQWLHRV